MLTHGNHGQLLHIQIDRHGDQIGITLAFNDLPGFDGLALHEMNGSRAACSRINMGLSVSHPGSARLRSK